ncbi:MAG: ribosome-binding factor A [Rickettsia sp.]|nr:ribosome-binding factor A [Rickettsia sp.]
MKLQKKKTSSRQLSSSNSHRLTKLSRIIKDLIIFCLHTGKSCDKRLDSCPITITRISLSNSKSLIKCFFIGFNTEFSPKELLKILNDSKTQIRHFLTQKLQFKYSPSINFYYDEGFFNLEDINKMLDT